METREKIIEMAKCLGQIIKEDEVIKKLEAAQEAYNTDVDVLLLTTEYKVQQHDDTDRSTCDKWIPDSECIAECVACTLEEAVQSDICNCAGTQRDRCLVTQHESSQREHCL